MECVLLVSNGVWYFWYDKKRQSVDLDEYIGWQDGIIVPIFYDTSRPAAVWG